MLEKYRESIQIVFVNPIFELVPNLDLTLELVRNCVELEGLRGLSHCKKVSKENQKEKTRIKNKI